MKADCPSLADEIAEPRQDVNVKVAPFTLREKSLVQTPSPSVKLVDDLKNVVKTGGLYPKVPDETF